MDDCVCKRALEAIGWLVLPPGAAPGVVVGGAEGPTEDAMKDAADPLGVEEVEAPDTLGARRDRDCRNASCSGFIDAKSAAISVFGFGFVAVTPTLTADEAANG